MVTGRSGVMRRHRWAAPGGGVRPLASLSMGDGPPVVLLHGQPGGIASWDRVTDLLAGDHHVVVPDRPGYGRTGGPATGFAGNARAVIDLLDAIGLEAAVVVGHSWGGAVALDLADRWPDRVTGLVLVASVDPAWPAGTLDRLLATEVLGDAASAVLFTAGAVLGPAARLTPSWVAPPLRHALETVGPTLQSGTWRAFMVEQRAYVTELAGLAGVAARIGCPTRVLVGTTDRIVRPAEGRHLAASLPTATLVLLEGTGHLIPVERPDAVAAAVRELTGGAGAGVSTLG